MTDTDSDTRPDGASFAVDENPSNTDVPYGGETTTDEAATRDTIVGGPRAEESRTATESDTERTTAPQSSFGMREAGIGAAVTVVGLFVAFGIPLLLV